MSLKPAAVVDARLIELASILAAGVLRLPPRVTAFAESQAAKETLSSLPARLEVPAETVLSVHRG